MTALVTLTLADTVVHRLPPGRPGDVGRGRSVPSSCPLNADGRVDFAIGINVIVPTDVGCFGAVHP